MTTATATRAGKANRVKTPSTPTESSPVVITPEQEDLALATYRKYPILFKKDFLKSPDFEPEQEEVFNDLFKYRRVAVQSCNNFGKDFIFANAVITALNIYGDDTVVIIVGPTHRQVKNIAFGEMRKIFYATNKEMKILDGEIHATDYVVDRQKNWFALGFTPRKNVEGDPSALQGYHASTVIVVFLEATGIDKWLFDAAEGLLTGGGRVFFWLNFNPTDITSKVGEIMTGKAGFGYHKIKRSCFDTPNIKANNINTIDDIRREAAKIRALTTPEAQEEALSAYKVVKPYGLSCRFVIESFIKWGEQSPLFQCKILGEFSTVTQNTLIPLQRVEELMLGRFVDEKNQIIWESELEGFGKYNGDKNSYIGVDAAREGDDSSVIAHLQGNRQFKETRVFPKTYTKDEAGTKLLEDSKFIAGVIKKEHIYAPELVEPSIKRQVVVKIDITGGYGLGIYDYLRNDAEITRNKYIKIVGVNFSSNASEGNELKYNDIISEMWIDLANDLSSADGILLLPDDELKAEISSRRKDYDNDLRERIEDKKHFKTRIGHSPDRGDAFALANAGRKELSKTTERAQSFIDMSESINSLHNNIKYDDNY